MVLRFVIAIFCFLKNLHCDIWVYLVILLNVIVMWLEQYLVVTIPRSNHHYILGIDSNQTCVKTDFSYLLSHFHSIIPTNICSTLNGGIIGPKQFWLEKDIQKSSNWKTTTFKHYFVESVLKLSCHFKRLMKNRSPCIGENREAMKWGPFNLIWYFLKTRCKIT